MTPDQPVRPQTLVARLDTATMLDSLAEGAYVTDLDRRIVFWNQAAERITGWTRADLLGRRCLDNILVHTDKDGESLCGQERCPLHRAMVTGQSNQGPQVIFAQTRSGARLPVEVSVAPLRDEAGKVIGGIETFRDMRGTLAEMLRARAIQEMALRPDLPPDGRLAFATTYRAYDLVGGDFFRLEQVDADRYAVLLADAQGHGFAAALNTLQLGSLCNSLRADFAAPGRFLDALSARLHPLVGEDGFFGTAIYALIDAASGLVRWVSAGHPPQLLFRHSGAVEQLGLPGEPLGMLPDSSFEETTTQLQPGDALLLFTDGATEVADHHERVLGAEGLARLVRQQTRGGNPAAFSLDTLAEQLLRFSNEIRLKDDLAMVKVRWGRG